MLAVRGLDVDIAGESGMTHAVKRLQLAISQRETFALVGESGCGKSMTALALLRLLPDAGRIVGGQIDLDGEDLNRLPESAMRGVRGGRIGIIFQEPSTSLNPVMRVGDQIIETLVAHTPLRGAAARARAIDWLRRVGIPEPERRVDDYPFQFSGGQKQRVMIAIALAAEPLLLIADEPTTALDVTVQAQVLALLADIQREIGMAVLLITHDLAVVRNVAHHVALMRGGEIVESASAEEFFRAPKHPYARALLRAAGCPTLSSKRGQCTLSGDTRHRSAADPGVRRLPLRAALRQGVRWRIARATRRADRDLRPRRSDRATCTPVRDCLMGLKRGLAAPIATELGRHRRGRGEARFRVHRRVKRALRRTRPMTVHWTLLQGAPPAACASRSAPGPAAARASASWVNAVDDISFRHAVAERRDAGAGGRDRAARKTTTGKAIVQLLIDGGR